MNQELIEKELTSPSLVIWPDSRLQRKASQLEEHEFGSTELTQFIIEMFNTLKEMNGLGLSACQIGTDAALFVYRVGNREGVMIHPKIVGDSSPMTHESQEGCLSFPGVYVKTQRFNHVTVQFRDEEGKEHEEEFIGLVGDCIQHEIEHLNGRTIVDHLSRLKKDIVTRKMKKLVKRVDRLRKVSKDVAKRAFRAPTSLEGTRAPNIPRGRDTGHHRVHLSAE